jgi:hypothetical protein
LSIVVTIIRITIRRKSLIPNYPAFAAARPFRGHIR